MAPWERELHFLSFIAQPLSFRKVPGRSVAYWERLQNATGILSPHALASDLDPFFDLAYCAAVIVSFHRSKE